MCRNEFERIRSEGRENRRWAAAWGTTAEARSSMKRARFGVLLGFVMCAPFSSLAQGLDPPAPETSSWVQLSQWFSSGAWPSEAPAADAVDGIQISGLFGTPSYPPADRDARSGGEEAAPRPQEGTEAPTYVDGIYAINEDYLFSYGENAWRILTGPARYDADDWTNVAIVAGLTGSLLLADGVLQDFWQDDVRGDTSDSLADGFRPLGEFKNLLYGSLGAYAVAEVFDAKREKAAALMAFQSVLYTALLTDGLKMAAGRERPANTDDRFSWTGPTFDDSDDSFPSGHASQSFAMASVLSEVYGDDHPWVPWIAYTAAGGTALSRVNDDRHWFSDVVFGGAIGYFVGKMVVRFNPFLEENGIAVQPFSEQGGGGVNLSLKF